MGDFDKKGHAGDAPAGAKRKQMLVGILGALLLSVVGFHFLKGSPQKAPAGQMPGAESGSAALPSETPIQAIAEIDRDPTAHLLLEFPALDVKLAAVPHNPFELSKEFRNIAKEPEPQKAEPIAQNPKKVVLLSANAPAIKADTLKLESVIRLGGNKFNAIINGNILKVGQTIADAMVVDIEEDHVEVRHKDWPLGPTTTIKLASKNK